jgi:ABC-type multidrug transport system permease subunit
MRAVLSRVWRNRRELLFWAFICYLLILAVILAVGSIHDAIFEPPTLHVE